MTFLDLCDLFVAFCVLIFDGSKLVLFLRKHLLFFSDLLLERFKLVRVWPKRGKLLLETLDLLIPLFELLFQLLDPCVSAVEGVFEVADQG